MGLKAQILIDSMGNITVQMRGILDYENTTPLRNELFQITTDNPASLITLDMHALDFVGSSGIGHFVETLKILNDKKAQIKLSNVKTEFIRVFKLYENNALEAMILKFESDDTQELAQNFAGRKRTFEN